MMKVKKIGVLSFVRLHTLIGILVGLILGILYSVGGFFIDLFVTLGWISSAVGTPGLSYGTVLAFGALVGMPIIFGLFGFAIGLIGAIVYNLFCKYFKNLRVEFE